MSSVSPAARSVLYAGYGSNLDLQRFRCYLEGGTPRGSTEHHPGLAVPEAAELVGVGWMSGRLRFVGHSTFWNGACADIDLDGNGRVAVALYRQTPKAVLHLWAGEAGSDPATRLPDEPQHLPDATHAWSGMQPVELECGRTAWVVTTDGSHPEGLPSDPYLNTMRRGLTDLGWSDGDISDYLNQWLPARR